MSYKIEQLQKTFEQLPDTVKDYIISDEVVNAIETLADWYDIPEEKRENFRKMILALEVGLMKIDDFISDSQKEFSLSSEEVMDLIVEINDEILEKIYNLFNQAVEQENKEEASAPHPINKNVQKFVGVPAYGVVQPASKYTSVLPRADIEMSKKKDAQQVDSFIKKLNEINAVPAAPTSANTVPKNLPATTEDVPSIALAKLSRSINIPRQEIQESSQEQIQEKKIDVPVVQKVTPTTTASATLPTPTPASPTPRPQSTYSSGADPYREPPTP